MAKAKETAVGDERVESVRAYSPAWTPPGEAPRIGDWVYFWMQPTSVGNPHPVPTPAQVIQFALNGIDVHLNVHGLGLLSFQLNVQHSPTPKFGCWSRRDES